MRTLITDLDEMVNLGYLAKGLRRVHKTQSLGAQGFYIQVDTTTFEVGRIPCWLSLQMSFATYNFVIVKLAGVYH